MAAGAEAGNSLGRWDVGGDGAGNLAGAKSAGNEKWNDPHRKHAAGGFLLEGNFKVYSHIPYLSHQQGEATSICTKFGPWPFWKESVWVSGGV